MENKNQPKKKTQVTWLLNEKTKQTSNFNQAFDNYSRFDRKI